LQTGQQRRFMSVFFIGAAGEITPAVY